MSSEKHLIAAADKAIASLPAELYQPSVNATATLMKSNLSIPEVVEAMPELLDFIAKGMAAQKAVDAIISKVNTAKHQS